MTLLDKLTYFIKPGLALLLIPFFFACDDPTDFGLELEPDQVPVSLRDTTITLPSTTVYMDSLRTDQYNLMTVGAFQDSIYGEVKAISYNEYNVKGGTLPADSLVFESAHLTLKMHTVRSKNPRIIQQLKIYQAQDTIYNQAVYLHDFSLAYNPDSPLATHSFDYNPQSDTIVKISLPDAFGQSLFDRLQKASSNDDYADSLSKKNFNLMPLVFAPGEDNEALFSFNMMDDTVGIYVNMINELTGNTYSYAFDFRYGNFTEVKRDLSSSTKLSGLSADFDSISVPSSSTYLDPLAGIYTKIDLKPLLNFLEHDENLLINLAQLTMQVDNNTSSFGVYPNKPTLQFYFVKETNDGSKKINAASIALANNSGDASARDKYIYAYTNAVLDESGYINSVPSLLNVGYDNENGQYKATTTLFAQNLADYSNNNNKLAYELLVMPSSVVSLTLGQASLVKPVTIKLHYTTLSNE